MTGFPPSVDDGPTDRRGLRVLDLEECLSRAAHHEIGRVAFASDGEITILPVTYLLDGAGVSFLTTWGSKLQVAADGGRMAFEVDETDPATRTGWSVLFQGSASIVEDPARVSRARRPAARVVGSRGHPHLLGAPQTRLGIRPRDRSGRVRGQLSWPTQGRSSDASVGRPDPVSGSFGDRRRPVLPTRTRRVARRPTPTWNPMLFGSQ